MGKLPRRVWFFVRQGRRADDLAEELTVHRDMTRRGLERAGVTDVDAAARRAFGSGALAQDRARDVWIPPVLQDLSRDVRFAARLFVKDPRFTAVAAGTLALAIGLNSTLFTIVNGMDNVPPVDRPERIVSLGAVDRAQPALGVSYLDYLDWHPARSFDAMAAVSTAAMTLTDAGVAADRVAGAYVSAGTFAIVGERPILGRDFRPDDDRPGAERVAIIGASVWKNRYAGDGAMLGRTITVNGVAATVVGVMRDGFRFPLVHDVWLPLASSPELTSAPRDVRRLRVVARLAPGVRLEQGRSELNAIAAKLSELYPATNATVRATVEPITGRFDPTNPWNAMRAASAIVLLIACANVANLLLARAAYRAKEIGIRVSLGASRARIVRQLLVESLLLAVSAGAAGVLLAFAGVGLWRASMPVANWPYWYHFAVDRGALAYAAEVALGSVLLFGLGPAVHLAKAHYGGQLKETSRGGTAPSARRWTDALLTLEFALTLSLLAGAALLARTLIVVYRADALVDTSRVMLAGVDLPRPRYAAAAQRIALYSELERRVGASALVDAAAVASGAPFYTAPTWSMTLEGQAGAEAPRGQTTSYVVIGSRYFDVLGLRAVRGRAFSEADGTAGQTAAIVNQLFASRYMPGLDPIGRRIRLTDPTTPNAAAPWLTIVGVTPTVRQHYAEEFDPVVYVPYRQNPLPGMVLLTRAAGDAASLTPMLREQLRQLDPDLPLVDVRPLDWLVDGTRFANRVFATLFGISAVLALLLAAVGLHAITAYAIEQRTQEIGVRMALGARPAQVVWLFVRRTLAATAAGVAVGLAGAVGVGQFVRGMLIGTSPTDPLMLTAISVVLVLVGAAAAFRPARRAALVDPAIALRYE